MPQNYYDVMQVCVNGHQTTDSYNRSPKQRKDSCPECGAVTIIACPACREPIRGRLSVPGVVSFNKAAVPKKCIKCNTLFPWAQPGKEPPATEARPQEIIPAAEPAAVPEKDTPPLDVISDMLSRFHEVAKQLRLRYPGRETLDVADEIDMADLICSLLKIHYDNVSAEPYSPSYSTDEKRAVSVNSDTVVLAKKTGKGFDHSELARQLNEDIRHYSEKGHRSLYCIVYDPEQRIPGLQDIDKKIGSLAVKVLIVPRNI